MKRSSGYTLVELLLAMGLFAAISTGLIALLARSSEFLTSGASQTETMDSLQNFAEAFQADVATLASRNDADTGMPEVRLLSDWVPCDMNADGRGDELSIQRLFFVRVMPDEAVKPLTRSAGSVVGASQYINQIEDEKKSVDATLKAPGGLQEVFWTAVPESKDDLAVLQIWRGYRAPPGGKDSILPTRAWHDPQASAKERGAASPVEIRAIARPLMSGVLYFGVDFWSRKTTSWDAVRIRDGGPSVTWDSTRGILPGGEGFEEFHLSKKQSYNDSASLVDPTDDTFPRKIRVTCVIEELGRNAKVGYLADTLSVEAKTIPLTDTRFFPATESARRYVKIDSEWIEVGVADRNSLSVKQRGARGTKATSHQANARVHHGRTFVSEYDVAAFRDTYRDELPALTGRGGGAGR